jgi:hypothetical protein
MPAFTITNLENVGIAYLPKWVLMQIDPYVGKDEDDEEEEDEAKIIFLIILIIIFLNFIFFSIIIIMLFPT